MLIKEGKTSKEIAELMNSSMRSVEFHRETLRKNSTSQTRNRISGHAFSPCLKAFRRSKQASSAT